MSLFEDLPALSPVQFFGVSAPCLFVEESLKPEMSYLVPSTEDLLGEETFADVYVGWSEEKVSVYCVVNTPFQQVKEGDFRRGDSIELFFDTRDLKTKSVVSKFCHHFIFFPVAIGHFYGREITRFRGEDVHRLCHPEDLQVHPTLFDDSYHLAIEIPAGCLHGYEPVSFPRLGFTYRINRTGSTPQHFAVSSEEYTIENHPALWGTLKLQREE